MELYIITKYCNNGESWEDMRDSEKPVSFFFSEEEAIEFASRNGTKSTGYEYGNCLMSYVQHKVLEVFECPIGKNWKSCDSDYDNEVCEECWNVNHHAEYDNSWVEYRIYKIERKDI